MSPKTLLVIAKKLRYNLLAAVSVALGLVNNIIYLVAFGTSLVMDYFVVVTLLLTAVTLILSSFSELTQYEFVEIQRTSERDAIHFFWSLFLIVFVSAVILSTVCVFAFLEFRSSIFPDVDQNGLELIAVLVNIGLGQAVVTVCISIVSSALLAYSRVALVYISQIIQAAVLTVVLIVGLLTDKITIYWLSWGAVAGATCSIFFLLSVIPRQFYIRPKFYSFSRMKHYIIRSLTMKTAHNINNAVVPYVSSIFLASLKPGGASEYSYGKKLSDIINAIVLGPNLSVFKNDLLSIWPTIQLDDFRKATSSFYRKSLPILLTVYVMFLLGVTLLFPWLFSKISVESAQIIAVYLALFVIWNIFLVLKAPFVEIVVIGGRIYWFYLINILNMLTFLVTLLVGWTYLGALALPLAFGLGEAVCWTIYQYRAHSILKKKQTTVKIELDHTIVEGQ